MSDEPSLRSCYDNQTDQLAPASIGAGASVSGPSASASIPTGVGSAARKGGSGPVLFAHEPCDLSRRDVRRRQGRSARLLSMRRTGLPQALRPADRDFRGDVWGGLHLLSSLLAP